jgi:hypothetical protein
MPIRPALLALYPEDWAQMSHDVRIVRAGGRCEQCLRPHKQLVFCLSDGRWMDLAADTWRDGRGLAIEAPRWDEMLALRPRMTPVVLATAHRDHDPRNRADDNLVAWCQRCHILHDRPHHRWQRWITYRQRLALGDLFIGPYDVIRYPFNGSRSALNLSGETQRPLSLTNASI